MRLSMSRPVAVAWLLLSLCCLSLAAGAVEELAGGASGRKRLHNEHLPRPKKRLLITRAPEADLSAHRMLRLGGELVRPSPLSSVLNRQPVVRDRSVGTAASRRKWANENDGNIYYGSTSRTKVDFPDEVRR